MFNFFVRSIYRQPDCTPKAPGGIVKCSLSSRQEKYKNFLLEEGAYFMERKRKFSTDEKLKEPDHKTRFFFIIKTYYFNPLYI